MGLRRLQQVEEYATKYVKFKENNKEIIAFMNRYTNSDLKLNEHDFAQMIQAYRELNNLHVQLLQNLAKNAKVTDNE